MTTTRLFLAMLAASACLPAPAVFATPPAAESPAAVQLAHISITATGAGPAIVLIPGLGSPRAVWDGVVPELAKTHRVLLVQVNGFGGDAPGANLKPGVLDGIVADLEGYLVANRVPGVKIVGHSMGGLAALMFARAHPDHVYGVMIVDSLPYFAVLMAPPGIDPTPATIAPAAAGMRDRIAAGYGKPLDAVTLAAQTRGLALKPGSIAKMQRWAAAADARVTAQALYEDLTTDLRPDLAAIRTPLTLVYPYNDTGPTQALAGAFYRKQYAAAPAIRYVEIGDAAHFVMLDQPTAFAAALAAFAAE